MIWFLMRQISIFAYYFYKSQKSPSRPVTNVGGKLSDWMPLLIQRPFLYHNSWMVKCPKYLFGCCPLVKTINDNSDILYQLSDLNPLQALSYLLLRRLAEVVVQVSASWLTVLILVWISWFVLRQKSCKNAKSTRKNLPIIRNSKYIWLVLFMLSLIFLTTYVYESVFRTPQPEHASTFAKTSLPILYKLWKNRLRSHKSLAISDFLYFPSLYEELYEETDISKRDETMAQKLCRTTKASLSVWSVLLFVGSEYAVIALIARMFIWFPLKSVFSKFCTKQSNYKRSVHGKRDSTAQTEKEIAINLKLESGDSAIRKHNRTYQSPRYISRGVRACLDEEGIFQNE